jgi:hypothetical protein
LRHAGYMLSYNTTSRIDTFDDRSSATGTWRLQTRRHRWTLQPTVPFSGLPAAAAPRGADGLLPLDRLTASDLFHRDAANEQWAQANPAGQGDVSDQNFLTAGHHAGIDTTGSTPTSPTSTRSIPPNPRQSGLHLESELCEPDLNRRPLPEIDGSC